MLLANIKLKGEKQKMDYSSKRITIVTLHVFGRLIPCAGKTVIGQRHDWKGHLL